MNRSFYKLACPLFFVIATCAGFASIAPAADVAELAADQAALASKFERLETLAIRVAELVEQENPGRAIQIREAIAKSRELGLEERLATVVDLLAEQQLAAAQSDQQMIADQLSLLLKVLRTDPAAAEREAERKRLQALKKQVRRLVRQQKGLRTRLLDGAEQKQLSAPQKKLATETKELAEQQPAKPSEQNESQPAPSSKPTPAQRLSKASKAMDAAAEQMQQAGKSDQPIDASRQQAAEKQNKAEQQLKQTLEEIEERLRQIREEEQERRLAKLETQLEGLLDEQKEIHRLTIETAASNGEQSQRERQIAAAGLGKRERTLAKSADKTHRLLLEAEGVSAFATVVDEVRIDMRTISERLTRTDLGTLTQGMQTDVIASLEEALEALDQTLQELQKKKAAQQSGNAPPGGDSQLVQKIAELKLIRSLQARIRRRTERWQKMATEMPAAEISKALGELSQRQADLAAAARQLGRPE